MNQKRLKTLFIFSDILASVVAWLIFYSYRKIAIEKVPFEISERLYIALLIIPLFWISLYYVLGTYNNLRRMYLMRVLSLSMLAFIIGTLCIFFVLLLDDEILKQIDYYKLLLSLFIIHSVITLIPRIGITYYIVNQIAKRKAGFRTLLIGGSQKAVEIFKEIKNLPKGTGNIFTGFIDRKSTRLNSSHVRISYAV